MNRTYPNQDCPSHKGKCATKISPFGFYKTKTSKRGSFDVRSAKPLSLPPRKCIFPIQHPRSKFDQVASLSVEGVSKSAISRFQSVGWNIAHRCLEKAAKSCRRFNRSNTGEMDIREVQGDEIRTFTRNKKIASWIFATMNVWPRF